MTYLGWFDDNTKKSVDEKIIEGLSAYLDRFSIMPNILLMNPEDSKLVVNNKIPVRVELYIRRNNFWFGYEG